MFEAKAVGFLYCVSPVHMGAGTTIGAIDNPIQRERHTGFPCAAGSGLKGAFRHAANTLWAAGDQLIERVFGPDTDHASEFAGALSFSDAQLVLFPVRSVRAAYVYVTCPTALERLRRMLVMAGVNEAKNWPIFEVQEAGCVVAPKGRAELLHEDKLLLETFEFAPKANGADQQAAEHFAKITDWLADHALPQAKGGLGEGVSYFRRKIANHTVLLSDEQFGHFVRHATIIEAHVRIDDATGTADDGGLFYTECLPPESLFAFLAMASKERSDWTNSPLGASDVLALLRKGAPAPEGGGASAHVAGFDGAAMQIGGDATTGRGQVIVSFAS